MPKASTHLYMHGYMRVLQKNRLQKQTGNDLWGTEWSRDR